MSKREWLAIAAIAALYAGAWKPVAWAVCRIAGWC